MLKAKSVQYEVLTPFGSWFSRYPIFKVYLIVYNSAGKFSTNVETIIFETRFPYSIEQAASPPVQWSRGLRPLLLGASPPGGGGVFSPGRACQRCNNAQEFTFVNFFKLKVKYTNDFVMYSCFTFPKFPKAALFKVENYSILRGDWRK